MKLIRWKSFLEYHKILVNAFEFITLINNSKNYLSCQFQIFTKNLLGFYLSSLNNLLSHKNI